MALTNIGSQKTPGRPTEVTFGADLGLPSDDQVLLLLGHVGVGATGTNTVIRISNVSDPVAASGEVATKLGDGTELAKMVLAAVNANAGGGTFPAIKVLPLASDEAGIPTAAQNAILKQKAEFLVTCYDLSVDSANRTVLLNLARTMSGAQRTSNNQFGTIGVGANRNVVDPANLFKFDTQYLSGAWLRDTATGDDAPAYSLGEVASAYAAIMAGNTVPFNPVDNKTIAGLAAPALESDWPSVGAGLESETCLQQGWSPLFVKPNTEVAISRSVTGRLSVDGTGSPVVGSYYDVQDFQVLYLFRKTIYTRFSQPDFTRRKASATAAQDLKSEAIRLALAFEDQGMFQAVSLLAKRFVVERNASDRHRFDVYIPVNVVPGLHVIATNIEATTAFDVVTV